MGGRVGVGDPYSWRRRVFGRDTEAGAGAGGSGAATGTVAENERRDTGAWVGWWEKAGVYVARLRERCRCWEGGGEG